MTDQRDQQRAARVLRAEADRGLTRRHAIHGEHVIRLDRLEDLELAELVRERGKERRVKVKLDDL